MQMCIREIVKYTLQLMYRIMNFHGCLSFLNIITIICLQLLIILNYEWLLLGYGYE